METNEGATLTYGRRSGAGGGEWREENTSPLTLLPTNILITDDPHHGLLLLISPWSGENSRGLYFSLL